MQSRFFRLDVDADVATVDLLRERLTEEDNIEEFGQELAALVDKQNYRKIIVCMRQVKYVTSSVIGKLIMLHRRLGRTEGQLVLTDVQPPVEEILSASQLLTYFNTAPDVSSARGTLA
ncbi:MAG: STAS domain-containing protein [Planctomyces sp.]|nr:STAS domain-containing protein [Planctomyces sp.]